MLQHLVEDVLEEGIDVSIPHRDYCMLQPEGFSQEASINRFQSLIGIIVCCNKMASNQNLALARFNPS